MEQKSSHDQVIQPSLDSPWADLALVSDFMNKELVKKLEWRHIKIFMAVNHNWQSFFGADAVWKPLLEQQYPDKAENVTKDYYKSFKHFYDLSNELQCPHKDAPHEGSERICPCVYKKFIVERNNKAGVARRFTGVKSEYYYCFPTWEDDCPCAEGPTENRLYRSYPVVCKDCMDFIIDGSYVGQHIGIPEEQLQRLDAEWIHEEFTTQHKFELIRPLPGSEKYIAIITDPHQVVLVTFQDKQVHIEPLILEEELTKLLTVEQPKKTKTEDGDDSDDDYIEPNNNGQDGVKPPKFDHIEVSACGRYVAVCQLYKTRAFVYNLIDKRVTFSLQRGSYQVRNSSFPIAFFVHEGKTLLIAAKNWNYLEVYDPETGEALRSRDGTSYITKLGKFGLTPLLAVKDNHLELFWCGIEVSPDQKSAASFGWMWHPVGMMASFSIEDWMTKDIFASEKAKVALDSEMWDTSFCFVDNDTIALWSETNLVGPENEFEETTAYGTPVKRQKKADIVLGYNVKTRHYTRLALPGITFYNLKMIGEYLCSLAPFGIQLTDPKTNVIFEVKNWTPATIDRMHGYNAHTKQFLSRLKSTDGSIDTTYFLSHIRWQ